IKDIAQELNISPSTVSRALADNPLVKPQTREAVKKLAKAYNYQPNFTALSLRNNKTKTLGIIIPQIVHEFFALVIRGLEDYAYAHGYSVIICSTHEMYEREVIDAKALLTGRVDGMLACVSKETKDYSHFQDFVDRNIPIVFFDCVWEDIASHKVVIDDFAAGYEATKHLAEQGCRSIAFVGGPRGLAINQDRMAGYRKVLEEHGLAFNEDWVVHCETGDFEDGLQSTKQLIFNEPLDGLFAATDMLAIGAMKNIKRAGKRIPEDVAVVGFSNWSISALFEPSLTTIDQPGYEMGHKAAELLIKQIKDPDNSAFETFTLQTKLVVRESSQRN
ncbi:MAG: LacI family DNA-binding transcriptional regulator, partial [Bacteroidota bacterium]